MPCGLAAATAASDPTLEAKLVPDWVKNVAGWWATDQIKDADFVNGIQYLVNYDILGIDNEKDSKVKVSIDDLKFSSVWGVDKDALSFSFRQLSLRFMDDYGDCLH